MAGVCPRTWRLWTRLNRNKSVTFRPQGIVRADDHGSYAGRGRRRGGKRRPLPMPTVLAFAIGVIPFAGVIGPLVWLARQGDRPAEARCA